ncbi:hypothetical protein [Thalassobellus citreus]|uniref:hypothetical protein n=1 Tax=Thalassobellus citreus TaxID=3367752 RepID=UPI0037BC818D
MKFSRLFYDSRVSFKRVPTNWVVISIMIGLLSTLTIYSFLCALNEAFRLFSFGYDDTPHIFNSSERRFYNLFFAGLSIVFGNSITILSITSRPSRVISRLNPLRKRIINDQIFLNFSFSYWFVKIGFVFGVITMCCVDINFLPSFKLYAYLLLFVLYLESWKALSRVLPKNRIKIQFLHLVILIVLSFGLSWVNVIDYKSIDKGLLENNPIINLPSSKFHDEPLGWRNPRVSFKVELDTKGDLAIYTERRERIDLNELPNIIVHERKQLREELIHFMFVQISADKNLDIRYIKKIEAELISINQSRVLYVISEDTLTKSYDVNSIKFKISKGVLSLKDTTNIRIPFYFNMPYFSENQIPMDTLRVSVGSLVKVNNSIIFDKKLSEEFKNYINEDVLFEYSYQKEATYQDYINVLSAHREAVEELRHKNQKFFKKHRWDNYKDYRDEQDKLRIQFPMQLIEKFD